jgi:large-conductance mechanosensitive channel
MTKLQKKHEALPAPVEDTKSEMLLAEIRDLLKK